MKSRLLPFLLAAFVVVLVVQQNRRTLRRWIRSLNTTKIEEVRTAPAASAESSTPPIAADLAWPWWRGPDRNGHARGPYPPLPFTFAEHVRWKVDLPGRGHASPVIDTDQVYLLIADEAAETLSLQARSVSDGKLVWDKELHRGGFEKRHSKNTHASSTPACDGEAIYCVGLIRGALRVSKVSRGGEILWQREAGPYESYHGYGGSPVLYESLVIVVGDSQSPGYLAALDRATGKLVWRTARETMPSHAAPVLAHSGGRDQVVVSGQNFVTAYAPQTGEVLWRQAGGSEETANTMAWNADLVFVGGGYPQNVVEAYRAENGERVWRRDLKVYVPSLTVFGERLLAPQDNGVIRLLEAATGKDRWTKRLGGDVTASPVVCGDIVLLANEAGKMFFFRAADKYESLGAVEFGNPIYATPAAAGGRLYVRTDEGIDKTGGRSPSKLYCIGAVNKERGDAAPRQEEP